MSLGNNRANGKLHSCRVNARLAFGLSLVSLALGAPSAHAEDDDAPQKLPEISVIDENGDLSVGEPANIQGHKNYIVTRSTTGSKVEQPDNWVPQSIVTVPQLVLQQQGNPSITSALQNVAGVTNIYPSYYPLDYWNNSYIRGFPVSMTLYDGLWDPTPFGNSWMGNVERVEVLKGPSGLLYGAYSGGIGGIINVETKRPKKDFYASASAEVDSYGSKSLIGDISTPIFNNKDWLVRVIGNIGNYKSFYDNSNADKRDLYASIEGLVTENDKVALSYEYRWQNAFPYSGIPGYAVVGSGATAHLVSLGTFNNDLNVYDPRSSWEYESNTGRASWEHRFNDNWTFKTSNQATVTSRDALSISATPSIVNGAPLYKQYAQDIRMGPVYGYDTDNMLHGTFSTFGLQHDLILGERYAAVTYDMNMARPTPYIFSTYQFTNPYFPNWGQPLTNMKQYMYGHSNTNQFNTYINDTISITDKWRVVAGLNYVNYSTSSESGMNPSNLSQSQTSGAGAAWRVGTLYDLFPGVTPYLSYSTTFKPQGTNTTDDGVIQTFSPLTGDQIEGGVKFDLNNKMSITASLYQITLSNVTQDDPDPVLGSLGYLVQTGTQRSRGVEIDGTYLVQAGWNVLFSYAYTDATYIEDDTYVVGSSVPNVPRNAFRLWSTYEVQDGPFKGVGIGGGVTAVGARQAALISQATPLVSATLPSYATVDAVLYYNFDRYNITLNLYNIFNEQYWAGSNGYTWLYPGEPFHGKLRFTATF